MKAIAGVIIVIAIVLTGVFFLRDDSDTAKQVASTKLSFSSIQNELTSGVQLLDVRTPEEFGDGHFKGAKNWPLQDLQSGKLPDVGKDTKLYVYCRSGNRSAEATTLLKSAGYTNVTDLGGLSDIQKLGGALTKE